MGKRKFAAAIVALVILAAVVYAGTVTVPNTFIAGTPAKAADVNANFSALAAAIQALQNAQGGAVVQDSNGKILGSYYPGNTSQNDFVLMKQAGLTFLVPITSAGFIAYGGFSYTQYDCGGTQYIGNTTGVLALQPTIVGTTAYFSGTAAGSMTILSAQANGECGPAGGLQEPVWNIGTTVDLSAFVPPFSLQ
jgi:hypothetical protein